MNSTTVKKKRCNDSLRSLPATRLPSSCRRGLPDELLRMSFALRAWTGPVRHASRRLLRGQQEGGGEEWRWYDDPFEPCMGFCGGEYDTGFECQKWDVDDSNERIRKGFDRRRETAVTTYTYAKETNWIHRWMSMSERSMLPAYVVLITLIVCILIAIGVVNVLPSIDEGISTESVTTMPLITHPTVHLADVTVAIAADNDSYTTDAH
ncbi:hypothetical protein MRX96_051490 [Rhipicephalus microplus]